MNITLVRPAPELKLQALDYREEHFNNGETIINGSELFDKIDSYDAWLEKVTKNANPETVDSDWVLTDTFFAVDNETGRIVGIADLRHTLNDFLINLGNSGYSVRPSERQKGYATEILRQLLVIAKQAGLKELSLSVERDNIPSIKTITKNGGIYDRSFEHEGHPADIYKIIL